MKRIAPWVFLLSVAGASFAAETQRYVVATRHPVRGSAVGSLSEDLREPSHRRVVTFEVVNAFAADLTAEEVAELRKAPDVRWIERNVPRALMSVVPGSQTVPYGIAQVRAPQTWTARQSAPVNVVVVDSGVDRTHPDIEPVYAGGFNVAAAETEPNDRNGHGTHVAGTVAAANNEFGVAGMVPNVRLWAVKAIDDYGSGTMEDVLKALDWVVKKKKEIGGRWVVNMSLGGDDSSDLEREAFARAVAEDVIVVAASGNGSKFNAPKPVAFPAAYPEVISVGAIDEQKILANFSNQGPELDFVAAGVGVTSTLPRGKSFASFARVNGKIYATTPLIGSTMGPVSGQFVYCGLGAAGDFPAAVQGKIALIKRGGDTFANKTRRAMQAGATAVIIFNHDRSTINFTLYDAEDPTTREEKWPVVVAMKMEDGNELAEAASGPISIAYEPHDYGDKNGTSMSTPHVTGAIALLWSLAPHISPASLTAALSATAVDLGTPGRDDQHGHGLVDVFAAAKMVAPEAFNANGQTTGRRIRMRGKK